MARRSQRDRKLNPLNFALTPKKISLMRVVLTTFDRGEIMTFRTLIKVIPYGPPSKASLRNSVRLLEYHGFIKCYYGPSGETDIRKLSDKKPIPPKIGIEQYLVPTNKGYVTFRSLGL